METTNGHEFDDYPSPVRSIVVQQLIQTGWITIVRMPVVDNEKNTPENVQKTIETIKDFFYKGGKAELSIQGCSVSIRGLDEVGGTFRVCASTVPASEPFTAECSE